MRGSVPCLVPFIMAQVIDIAKGAEPRPASIVDNDIEAPKLLHRFLDEPLGV